MSRSLSPTTMLNRRLWRLAGLGQPPGAAGAVAGVALLRQQPSLPAWTSPRAGGGGR